jgi:Zinc finger, ZZ type
LTIHRYKGFLLFELEVKVNKDNLLKLHTDVYQFLKPRAIEMYCGDSATASLPVDWEKYTVEFKCFDSDGDLILVRSNEDFRILLSQNSGSHCMKVLAKVTPPQPSPTTEPQPDSSASKSTQTQEKNEAKTQEDANQTHEKETVADERVDKIISAIAELFTIAALSMKAGVTAVSHQENLETVKTSSKQHLRNVKKASEDSIKAARLVTKESLKIAKKISKESLKQVCQALKTGVDVTPIPISEAPSPPADVARTFSEPTEDSCLIFGIDDGPVESPPEPELPFIHGRHTCDQCLTTPVIGKRFHALNKPDYDLCEVCFGNYKGTDIVFEEVKLGTYQYFAPNICVKDAFLTKVCRSTFVSLERDMPFQERWNRRRVLHEASMKRRACLNNRRSCNRHKNRNGGRGVPAQCEDVNSHDALDHNHGSESPVVSTLVSSDPALEEAIRRSLDDIVQTNVAAEKETISEEIAVNVVLDLETEDLYVAQVSDSFSSANLNDSVVEKEIVLGLVENEQSNMLSNDASFASEAIGSGDVAAFVGETLDRLGEAIEDRNAEMEDYASGPKIVDGDEDAASTGSWSVIAEKENAENMGDEGLGRAAEAIGSALFQSDMMRSTEDGTLSSMTKCSSVASVPTYVPSIAASEHDIPQAQLDRWAAQLGQLRELGFSDDAVCVDALEALAAANIGVDSDEEVSVQQVIEKLMCD